MFKVSFLSLFVMGLSKRLSAEVMVEVHTKLDCSRLSVCSERGKVLQVHIHLNSIFS